MLVSCNADFFGAARARVYTSMDAVEADWPAGTMEHSACSAFFASDRTPPSVVIGRGANKPTLVYTQSIAVLSPGSAYTFRAGGSGVTTTTISVVAKSSDLTISAVTTGADTVTVAGHGELTGAGPYYVASTGGLPAGLAAQTPYWLIRVDDDTLKFAASQANAIAGTAIDLTTTGTGTHTITRTGNDVLVERVVAGLQGVAGKNYTATAAGATGSKSWTVTGNAAGSYFFIGIDHALVTSAVTNADPGIAADLAAIRAENKTWYELHTSYNSTATVLAAAAWIESSTDDLAYHPSVSATAIVTGAVGSAGAHDIGDQLKTLERLRTATWYHPDPGYFIAEAAAGRMLPTPPGSAHYAFKQLRGVAPVVFTDSMRANLEAKNVNSYEVVQQVAVTFVGKVSAGEWISVVRNNDYANASLQTDLWNMQVQNDQVPFTPDGRAMIKSVFIAWMSRMVKERIYRDDEESQPIIDLPLVKDISAADRASGRYGIGKWTAQSVGAIVYLDTSGTVYA
jgi:plastocyanin